jgi:hypothetical protein
MRRSKTSGSKRARSAGAAGAALVKARYAPPRRATARRAARSTSSSTTSTASDLSEALAISSRAAAPSALTCQAAPQLRSTLPCPARPGPECCGSMVGGLAVAYGCIGPHDGVSSSLRACDQPVDTHCQVPAQRENQLRFQDVSRRRCASRGGLTVCSLRAGCASRNPWPGAIKASE